MGTQKDVGPGTGPSAYGQAADSGVTMNEVLRFIFEGETQVTITSLPEFVLKMRVLADAFDEMATAIAQVMELVEVEE